MSRQGRPLGRADGYKVGESEGKLEPMRVACDSHLFLTLTLTYAAILCGAARPPSPSAESEKLQEDFKKSELWQAGPLSHPSGSVNK